MIGGGHRGEDQSFGLVPFFVEFHAELLRLKRIAAQANAPGLLAPVPDADPDYMVRRLQSLLESQTVLAGRRASSIAMEHVREAQYVMAALADETFLYGMDWRGRTAWRENVLEFRLFGTRNAGEQIFASIEEMLRLQDRRQAELAPIYILALSLGFRGRFRAAPDRGIAAVKGYSRRLFEFAFERPVDLQAPDQVLAAAAYGPPLTGSARRHRLFRPTWPLALAGIVVAFLLVSEATWLVMAAPLGRAAGRVMAAAAPDTPPLFLFGR